MSKHEKVGLMSKIKVKRQNKFQPADSYDHMRSPMHVAIHSYGQCWLGFAYGARHHLLSQHSLGPGQNIIFGIILNNILNLIQLINMLFFKHILLTFEECVCANVPSGEFALSMGFEHNNFRIWLKYIFKIRNVYYFNQILNII